MSNYSSSASDMGGTSNNLVVWYNNKGRHALPAYVNAAHNAILRAKMGDEFGQLGITAFSHPMVVSEDDVSIDSV